MSTIEAEPNEESLADMTATSEHEASESMELPDEQSRYEENKHSGLDSDWDSGSEADSEPDLDSDEYPICTETVMVDDEENPGMSESKKARDEDDVEKTTTESEHKDADTTKEPVCTETKVADTEENPDMSESKNARNEDGIEKTTTESKHKDAETTKDPVCTETAMVDDEENSDMPENRKESTTSTKSDKDDIVAIAASNQEEKEKSANNIYMQGVQCENNMEFCKAIELYKQAAELENIAAVHKLSEFHSYDANDFYKMCEWCEWASTLFSNVECLKDLNIRYEALPSCATPGSKLSISNQIYECKIELNSLKNKLKSLESNLFIMKDKIKNSPFAWYKNAAKIISVYLDTLQSENIEISPEPLYDFSNYCEIIKNENPENVLNWLEIASKSGNADVMCKLAEYYETGKGGLPQDLIEVAYLLGQAAGNGHVEAMYKLGIMFMEGRGVVQNLELGISWLQRAADEDNIEALRALASCYEKGNGVPQNDEIVIGLLQKINTLSEIDEICKSAYRYEYGVGVDQNLVLAASLYLVTLTTLNENMSIMAVKLINKDFFRCYNKILNNRISLETDRDGIDFFENEGYKQFLLH